MSYVNRLPFASPERRDGDIPKDWSAVVVPINPLRISSMRWFRGSAPLRKHFQRESDCVLNSKWLGRLSVAAVVSLVASAAQATTLINLDVNGYFDGFNLPNVRSFSGQAVLGSGSWTVTNAIGAGTKSFSSLSQADGTPTSVQVALTNISQGYAQPSPVAGYGQALMRDYLFLQHPTGGQITSTLTISGLNTMSGYVSGVTRFDIAIYSSARVNTDASTWTLGGTTKTSGVSDVTSPTEFIEGNDYVLFSGIADSSGTITATWTKEGSHEFSSFNGIQILATVPEPSTVALLGVCAGLPLLGVFRRLQKRCLAGISQFRPLRG